MALPTEPQGACLQYIIDNDSRNVQAIELAEFDDHCHNRRFTDGPFEDTAGSGYGEPYNPHPQVFGRLDTGQIVYAQRG